MTVTGVDVYTTDMTIEEAKECVRLIHTHLGNLRALLLELYQRKGWRVLGYASWRQCAVQEFAYDETYLYRMLSAAITEQNLNLPIGEIPESHLRPITALEPEAQRIVYNVVTLTAEEMGIPVTASLMKSIATVAATGILTGTLDGKHKLTDGAKLVLAGELEERLKRQKQYIHDSLENASQKRHKAQGTFFALHDGELHVNLETGDLKGIQELIGKRVLITIREATDG